MRSIARWVLPVLVGPSTAVTPVPRARASRLVGDENEMAIADLSGCELPSSRRLADSVAPSGEPCDPYGSDTKPCFNQRRCCSEGSARGGRLLRPAAAARSE